MAYTLTYDQLLEEAKAYVDDDVDEFVAQLPVMVQRAQDRIQLELALEMWMSRIDDSLSTNSSAYQRKPGWLRINEVWCHATGLPVEKRNLTWCRMFNAKGAKGAPRYWAEDGETALMFAPISSGNHALTFDVMARQEGLSAAVQSNWFSQNVAQMLLWATLIEAEHFLLSQERVAEFETLYQTELVRVRSHLDGMQVSTYATLQAVAGAGGGA